MVYLKGPPTTRIIYNEFANIKPERKKCMKQSKKELCKAGSWTKTKKKLEKKNRKRNCKAETKVYSLEITNFINSVHSVCFPIFSCVPPIYFNSFVWILERNGGKKQNTKQILFNLNRLIN